SICCLNCSTNKTRSSSRSRTANRSRHGWDGASRSTTVVSSLADGYACDCQRQQRRRGRFRHGPYRGNGVGRRRAVVSLPIEKVGAVQIGAEPQLPFVIE